MSNEKPHYPKRVYRWDGQDTQMVNDAEQERQLGAGWFDSTRKALEEMHRRLDAIQSVAELSKFEDKSYFIDAYYNRKFETSKGEARWNYLREYQREFPTIMVRSDWPRKYLSIMPLEVPHAVNQSKPIEWLGTAREWGDTVLRLYESKKLLASSPLNALEHAAEHFVWRRRSGRVTKFNPRSVWQNLRNRDDYQNPRKPGPR